MLVLGEFQRKTEEYMFLSDNIAINATIDSMYIINYVYYRFKLLFVQCHTFDVKINVSCTIRMTKTCEWVTNVQGGK